MLYRYCTWRHGVSGEMMMADDDDDDGFQVRRRWRLDAGWGGVVCGTHNKGCLSPGKHAICDSHYGCCCVAEVVRVIKSKRRSRECGRMPSRWEGLLQVLLLSKGGETRVNSFSRKERALLSRHVHAYCVYTIYTLHTASRQISNATCNTHTHTHTHVA